MTALLASVTAIIVQSLDVWIAAIQINGNFAFDKVNFLLAIKVAVFTWLGDMLRRFAKSSATVIRVKPGLPDVVKKDDDGPGSDVPPVPPTKP